MVWGTLKPLNTWTSPRINVIAGGKEKRDKVCTQQLFLLFIPNKGALETHICDNYLVKRNEMCQKSWWISFNKSHHIIDKQINFYPLHLELNIKWYKGESIGNLMKKIGKIKIKTQHSLTPKQVMG